MRNCKPRRKFAGFGELLESCPEKDKHTPCPEGYVDRSLWAEKMMISHNQVRCAGCGLYAIWVLKPSSEHNG